MVTTLAGTAGQGGSADGTDPAARFSIPVGVAVDPTTGDIYVADTVNDTIRMITPAGVVTTLAGTAGTSGSADGTGPAARFNEPTGVTVDPTTGDVFVADYGNNTIRGLSPPGRRPDRPDRDDRPGGKPDVDRPQTRHDLLRRHASCSLVVPMG